MLSVEANPEAFSYMDFERVILLLTWNIHYTRSHSVTSANIFHSKRTLAIIKKIVPLEKIQ